VYVCSVAVRILGVVGIGSPLAPSCVEHLRQWG
jgi:hypothetical protein